MPVNKGDMNAPIEAIREQLDRLESDAQDIEKWYTEFFGRVSSYTGSFHHRYWSAPSDELEQVQRQTLQEYEIWYNSATSLVVEYLPDRTDDFEQYYRDFKQRLQLNKRAKSDAQKVLNAQNADFDSQRSILRSIPPKVRIEELRVRKQVSKNVAQSELDKARELLNDGEIRVGGVLSGVALERYLLMFCENSSQTIEHRHNDGVSALAQKLYEADEIDQTIEKHLQYLAGIRADCAHANRDEPDDEDVRQLIEDTDDFIRGRKM